MEIRVPIDRSMVLDLLRACFWCLVGKSAMLSFECEEMRVNGEEKPLILSRQQAAELQRNHLTTAAKATLLEELVTDTMKELPEGHPIAEELKSGLDAINEARILH